MKLARIFDPPTQYPLNDFAREYLPDEDTRNGNNAVFGAITWFEAVKTALEFDLKNVYHPTQDQAVDPSLNILEAEFFEPAWVGSALTFHAEPDGPNVYVECHDEEGRLVFSLSIAFSGDWSDADLNILFEIFCLVDIQAGLNLNMQHRQEDPDTNDVFVTRAIRNFTIQNLSAYQFVDFDWQALFKVEEGQKRSPETLMQLYSMLEESPYMLRNLGYQRDGGSSVVVESSYANDNNETVFCGEEIFVLTGRNPEQTHEATSEHRNLERTA